MWRIRRWVWLVWYDPDPTYVWGVFSSDKKAKEAIGDMPDMKMLPYLVDYRKKPIKVKK